VLLLFTLLWVVCCCVIVTSTVMTNCIRQTRFTADNRLLLGCSTQSLLLASVKLIVSFVYHKLLRLCHSVAEFCKLSATLACNCIFMMVHDRVCCCVDRVYLVEGSYPKQLIKLWDLYAKTGQSQNDRPGLVYCYFICPIIT